jgi:hypothetical protein
VGLAVLERMTALIYFPIVISYLVILKLFPITSPPGLNRRNLAILLVPPVIVLIFESVHFLANGDSFLLDLVLGQSIDDPFRLLVFTAFNLRIPILVLGLLAGLYLSFEKSRSGLFFLLSSIFPVGVLFLASPFIFTKARYIFISLPFWTCLVSILIKEMYIHLKGSKKIWAVGLLVVCAADALFVDIQYFTINHGHRRNWKAAFAEIDGNFLPGDVVASSWAELGNYYLSQEVIWMGDITPEEVLQSGRRYWFVADSESVFVTGPIHTWVFENARLVNIWYLRVPEDISLRLYLYDPKGDP